MKFASAMTDLPGAEDALPALVDQIAPQLGDETVHLLFVFLTAHYEDQFQTIVDTLGIEFPDATMIGCSAEGILGTSREIERLPAISLLAASLPGVSVRAFHLSQEQLEAAHTGGVWEPMFGVCPEDHPTFFAFADPFRFNFMVFIDALNDSFAQCPVFGGIASAAEAPGQNALILDGRIYNEGLVGAALTGNIQIDAVVSQGCRPIGKPYVVTKSQGQFIRELGGKTALVQLEELFNHLSPTEGRLAHQALSLGRAINEYKPEFKRGDFLIQNLIGVDRDSGALAIAGTPKVGSTVQFHVRDADSADEDLRKLLSPFDNESLNPPVEGALLFSCNGRGRRMWPKVPNHDAGALSDTVGPVPMAGFFCAGEFGPIGGQNFIHGYTASIALLRPRNTHADTSDA